MKKYNKHPLPLLFFCFFAFSYSCQAKTLMTTEQLKAETGKGVSASLDPTGRINLAMDGHTNTGVPISVTGTIDILQKTEGSPHQPVISLSDSALQGSRAFSTVIAVGSTVQVLSNLIVNINSTVGDIVQGNYASSSQGHSQ